MSHQCVPRWDNHDDINLNSNAKLDHLHSSSNSIPRDVSSMLDYEVAELTWENGQPGMNGLGQPRVPFKLFTSISEMMWEKPRAGGTLESIVDQATNVPKSMLPFMIGGPQGNELVPWFQHHRSAATTVGGAGVSATVTMDAMVPCSNEPGNNNNRILQPLNSVSEFSNSGVGCSTRADSCSVPATHDYVVMKKCSRVMASLPVAPTEWSSREQSVSGSATFDKDSPHLTVDTLGFTSISAGSPDNTSSDKLASKPTIGDDDDSVFLNKPQKDVEKAEEKKKGNNRKSSVSTKRSRAAAVHNQSERKRRDKINERMKTLQKMVPNSSKTDKASMLDEVIEYLKQLQAQLNMMNTMNMSPMMLPLAMQQQQLQMSMMGPMGLGPIGMGLGLGVMDMSTMGRHNMAVIPPVLHPSPFLTLPSWDGSGDRLPIPLHDPLSTFAVCQPQPMTMEAYSRMAALYQQMHHHQSSSSKS